MNNPRYAPGPWRAEGWQGIIVNDSTGATLAVAPAGHDYTLEQIKSNARLMASAPELLQALKQARTMLETAIRYFPKSIRNSDRFSLLNVIANAVTPAINKAEGAE